MHSFARLKHCDRRDLATSIRSDRDRFAGPQRSREQPSVSDFLALRATLDLEDLGRKRHVCLTHGCREEIPNPRHQLGYSGTCDRRPEEERIDKTALRL